MFPALYQHSKQKNQSMTEAVRNDSWISDLMHNITTPLSADAVKPCLDG
jgi:hypothetical protein